jgi:hypothetical protein
MDGREPEVRPEDVLVLVRHPFGDVWATLAAWREHGPGSRLLVRPVAAKSRLTGESLPVTMIPLPYRNDDESRAAVRRGEFPVPWGRPFETGAYVCGPFPPGPGRPSGPSG